MESYWDRKHNEDPNYTDLRPSKFSEFAIAYMPAQGMLLELGAGSGNDSRSFAQQGLTVTSTDLSEVALARNRQNIPDDLQDRLTIEQLDLADPFPYEDRTFDVVYAHMSIHYFDDADTDRLFHDVRRVLRPGGKFIALVNSTEDDEFGQGQKIDDFTYEIEPGKIKRFFSLVDIWNREQRLGFESVFLDQFGSTYKDDAIGNQHLIRFVAMRIEPPTASP